MLGQERLHYRVTGDAKGFKGAIQTSQKSLNGFQNQIKGVASNLKLLMTGALVGAGYQSVRLAKDFTKSMTQIKALVGVASDEVDAMGESARKMAVNTGVSANEAAEALFFITSAGLRGKDAMAVLEQSLKAASVGLGETKVVADLATSALNAYGVENLTASDATDVLVSAVREGKLEASELGDSMGRVLPIASQLGVDFHEVGGAFAAMSRTGTNAAEASTAIKGILLGLIKPTEKGRQELRKMNLSYEGLRKQLKEEGLLSLLETLKLNFEGNVEAQQNVFNNSRALLGVMDLLGKGIDSTRVIMDNMSKSTGATETAFEDSKSASKDYDIEIAKLNDHLLEIGQTTLPLVNKGLRFLNFLLGGKPDDRSAVEIALDRLDKLQKKVDQTTGALEYWQKKGLEGEKIQRFIDAVEEAKANLEKQKLVVEELTTELDNLDKQTDKNSDSNNDNVETIKNLNEEYDNYLEKIKELQNAEKILGDEFDLTNESIKLTQETLIELLNLGKENTLAFGQLTEELRKLQSLEAVDLAEKMGDEADLEFDDVIDFSELEKELENVKTFRDELNAINEQANADLSQSVDSMFEEQNQKRLQQFQSFQQQVQQVAGIMQQHLVGLSDQFIASLGLANEGIQGIVQSMLKVLMQLAIQSIINAAVSKALAKGQVASQFSTAQAGAISSATNTASLIPGGFFALPGMIAAATSLVGGAFAGLTAFAEGGIVTRPVMGLVGEAGAEAIIPLEKLPHLMNASQGTQKGQFTLRGQDLVLALERAGDFRTRITG
jgi:TP901 family phage tail tape measure protein|tara:strand:- start:3538 stop:5880 length:2343 start_codon:yes stop_codon:yes gene_type:complete